MTTNVVTAAVIALESAGVSVPVYAWRRWADPLPGSAVVVLSATDDWAAVRTTAQTPTLRAMVYANSSDGQEDAEAIALDVAQQVRSVLHIPQHGVITWGGTRIMSSIHVGSGGPAEVEGHEAWRVVSQVYEVQTT